MLELQASRLRRSAAVALTKQEQDVRLAAGAVALPPQALLHDAVLQLQTERVRERRLEDVVADGREARLGAERRHAARLRVGAALAGELSSVLCRWSVMFRPLRRPSFPSLSSLQLRVQQLRENAEPGRATHLACES